MRMAEIIGRNIQSVMNDHSVTALELAKLVGVTRQTFSNYLSGESTIDSEKLSIIANFFSKPFEYFFEEKQSKLSFMFRATNPRENMDDESLSEIQKYMENYFEISCMLNDSLVYLPEQYNLTLKYNSKIIPLEDLGVNFRLWGYKIPQDLESIIENIAIDQRKKLGLEESVGTDLIKTLEEIGIKILFKRISNLSLFGISAFDKNKGFFILINDHEDISEERKLFSLAHEYAHIILHRDCYSNRHSYGDYGSKKNIIESTADTFAGYFLMPRQLVKKYDQFLLKKSLLLSDLVYVKQELKVSLMALTMTLHKYKYINDATKSKIFDILKEKGFSKKEPATNLQLTKNQKYNFIVKTLYLSDKIDKIRVSNLLDEDSITTDKIIQKWEEERLINFL